MFEVIKVIQEGIVTIEMTVLKIKTNFKENQIAFLKDKSIVRKLISNIVIQTWLMKELINYRMNERRPYGTWLREVGGRSHEDRKQEGQNETLQ